MSKHAKMNFMYASDPQRESPPSPLSNGGLSDSFIDLADIEARLARIERILNASLKVKPPLRPKRVIYTPGPPACDSAGVE